jgi:hypothetical protein
MSDPRHFDWSHVETESLAALIDRHAPLRPPPHGSPLVVVPPTPPLPVVAAAGCTRCKRPHSECVCGSPRGTHGH